MKQIITLVILLSIATKCNNPKSENQLRTEIVNQTLNKIKSKIKIENLKEKNFNYRNNHNDNEYEEEYSLSNNFLNLYGIPKQNLFIDDSLTLLDAHIIKVPIFFSENEKDSIKSISFEFIFINKINNTDFQSWSLIQEMGNDSAYDKLLRDMKNKKGPEYLNQPIK